MTARRGPGHFVGDVAVYDCHSSEASIWGLTVHARGPVKARTLEYKEGMRKLSMRPEVEADIRAGESSPNKACLTYQTIKASDVIPLAVCCPGHRQVCAILVAGTQEVRL